MTVYVIVFLAGVVTGVAVQGVLVPILRDRRERIALERFQRGEF